MEPWFLPHDYGASSESTPSVPVLPTIPQDVLAQDVDLNDFAEWKEAMWSARQVEVMTSYCRMFVVYLFSKSIPVVNCFRCPAWRLPEFTAVTTPATESLLSLRTQPLSTSKGCTAGAGQEK
eukprot:3973126-Amphidinium_carterae.1